MNEENLIQSLTKDYHLCYPCEFFVGHITSSGQLSNFTKDCYCLQGLCPMKCGICRDLANHLISIGCRLLLDGDVLYTKEQHDITSASIKSLQRKIDELYDLHNVRYQHARKQAVRDVLLLLREKISLVSGSLCVAYFLGVIDDIAKDYGVDIS